MDVERERRWNALLLAALEVEPDERRDHLGALGAEPDLIEEILESLDTEAPHLGDFLERPAGLPDDSVAAGEESARWPETIAGHRILGRLGVGGMGEVFRARQETPVRREVALKRIQAHLPEGARVRFLAEQQALARLAHGSVARFFEAGTTDDGRPWFTMEVVEGEEITGYCDREWLPVAERLRLFLGVCAAVEHAHQRQILHRDLKPSNVMVVEEDGRPVPKVIDFGIAKLLDAAPELRTLQTRTGFVGTPGYSSPEALSRNEVDTRTDVYSLGVLLTELLVGERPFQAGDPPLTELLRRVREDEPEPPGRLLERLAPSQAERVARERQTGIAALRRTLDGDLRWIIARTQEKDPERRYGSVRELAEDLERHLDDEPVFARPPTVTYRLGKLARRHRRGVAAGLVAVLGLLAGAVGLGVGMVRAREEAAAARAALAESQELSDFLVGLFREADPTAIDGEDLSVAELLDRGADQIRDRLADQPAARGRFLQTLADVYMERGRLDRAEPMLREAVELFETALLPGDPARASVLRSLGVLRFRRGEWAEAEDAFRRSLDSMDDGDPEQRALARHNLGVAVHRQGRHDEAEEHFRAALDLRRRNLDPDHPHLARSFNALGALLISRGRPAEARPFVRASVEHRERTLGPDHPDLAKALVNAAVLERDLGDFDAAVTFASRATAIEEAALGPEHPDLVITLGVLADALLGADRVDESLEASERTVAILRIAGGPSDRLALGLSRHAYRLLEGGRLHEAERTYREAGVLYAETAPPEDPVHTGPRLGLAFAAWKRGDLDLAESETEAVMAIREASEESFGSPTAPLRILAGVAAARGETQRALELYRQTLEIWREKDTVGLTERRTRQELAEMLRGLGRADEAAAALRDRAIP